MTINFLYSIIWHYFFISFLQTTLLTKYHTLIGHIIQIELNYFANYEYIYIYILQKRHSDSLTLVQRLTFMKMTIH